MDEENRDTKKERGRRIRYLRESNGLTLQELAEKIGVRYQSLREWEVGKTSPSVDNIGKLAEIFCVHPTWIWTGQGPKNIKRSKEYISVNRDEGLVRTDRRTKAIYELMRYLKTKSPEEIKLIHEVAMKIFGDGQKTRRKNKEI